MKWSKKSVVLELVPLGEEKIFKPRPKNRMLVPLKRLLYIIPAFFEHFSEAKALSIIRAF